MRGRAAIRVGLACACFLVACFLVQACSATEVEWERIEDPRFVAEDGSYSLELPLGWVRAENSLTRDGWKAQVISFNAGPVLETEDGSAIDATAPELIVALQEQLSAQPGVEVIDCRSVTLDALPGFRMHFTTQGPVESEEDPAVAEGTTVMVLYGAVEGVTLYAFSFESRRPETFERDLVDFERLVASFDRLGSVAPGP